MKVIIICENSYIHVVNGCHLSDWFNNWIITETYLLKNVPTCIINSQERITSCYRNYNICYLLMSSFEGFNLKSLKGGNIGILILNIDEAFINNLIEKWIYLLISFSLINFRLLLLERMLFVMVVKVYLCQLWSFKFSSSIHRFINILKPFRILLV